jgi:hypothetical protein
MANYVYMDCKIFNQLWLGITGVAANAMDDAGSMGVAALRGKEIKGIEGVDPLAR